MDKPKPIGVLDSGVGGLTVVRALQTLMPNESIVYVGDTARAPYGGLSADTLFAYSREIVSYLIGRDVKAVVLACGSISSTAFDALRDAFPDMPLIDVIRPGVKTCARLASENPGLRVGFIATAATVKKGLFMRLLREECPDISIVSRACPLFAPMAERGLFTGVVPRWAAENYLAGWRGKIDALVLGCTHYPLLSGLLSEILAPVRLVDFSAGTASATAAFLQENNALRNSPTPPHHEFYVTGDPEKFNATAQIILQKNISARQINL